MKNYRSAFWINSIALLLVIALIVSNKILGSPVGELFRPPASPQFPNERLLTYTFQILCSVPAIVCAFSWALLRKIKPENKRNGFILSSALLTGSFLLNEIFRIHIICLQVGIPKLVFITLYATIVLLYGGGCWRHIKSTPYVLLLTGMGLLFSAIAIDSLHLSANGAANLLEGIPKLFSEVNIALYFWYVCYQEVLQAIPIELSHAEQHRHASYGD